MLTSWAIWFTDLYYVICWPTSYYQGHSVWHFGCALSVFLFFIYYTTIQRLVPQPTLRQLQDRAVSAKL